MAGLQGGCQQGCEKPGLKDVAGRRLVKVAAGPAQADPGLESWGEGSSGTACHQGKEVG